MKEHNEVVYRLTEDFTFPGGIVIRAGTGVRRGRPEIITDPEMGEMWPCIWEGTRTGKIPTRLLKRIA